MPNYRYNSPEYARRNTNGRDPMTPSPVRQEEKRGQCCEEVRERDRLCGLPLAMAYVPWQEWKHLFELKQGFCCGTIFKELYKPFQGMGGSGR